MTEFQCAEINYLDTVDSLTPSVYLVGWPLFSNQLVLLSSWHDGIGNIKGKIAEIQFMAFLTSKGWVHTLASSTVFCSWSAFCFWTFHQARGSYFQESDTSICLFWFYFLPVFSFFCLSILSMIVNFYFYCALLIWCPTLGFMDFFFFFLFSFCQWVRI